MAAEVNDLSQVSNNQEAKLLALENYMYELQTKAIQSLNPNKIVANSRGTIGANYFEYIELSTANFRKHARY